MKSIISAKPILGEIYDMMYSTFCVPSKYTKTYSVEKNDNAR